MKLPRYSSRALPRTAVVSPQEAAAGAAAPFQAAASVLSTGAQAAKAMHETDERIRAYEERAAAAEFEIEVSTMDTDNELALKEFATQEKWNQDVQEDGRDTPTAMQFEAEEVFRGILERAGELAERAPDDLTRKQIMAGAEDVVRKQRAELEISSRNMRNDIMGRKVGRNINARIESGNFDGARFEVERALEMGVMSEDSAAAAKVDIRKAEVADTAATLANEYFERAAIDVDDADQWLQDNVMSLEDEDVRKAAMAQASTMRNQINAANKADRAALQVRFINAYRADVRRARENNLSTAEAEQNYLDGTYGPTDEPETAQRFNAVMDSIHAQAKQVDQVSRLESFIAAGIVEDNAANRKGLDEVLANRLVGVGEGADPRQVAADLFREAGLISHMANVKLSQAANSPDAAFRAYQDYKYFVQDGERVPRMHISDDAKGVLAEVHSRVAGGGYSEDEAIAMVFQMREANVKEPGLLDSRRAEFSNEQNVEAFDAGVIEYVEAQIEAQFPGAFQVNRGSKTGSLFERMPSVTIGPSGKKTPLPEHMMNMISTAAMDHYAMYGRMEGALQFGFDKAAEKYSYNNLNGDWQFQFMGLDGDVADLGRISKQDMIAAGGEHWVRSEGTWQVKRLSENDMDRMSFEPILIQPEDGPTEYMVMFDGNPINRSAPQEGVTPEYAVFTFGEGVESAYQATASLRQDMTQIQREIDRLYRVHDQAEDQRLNPDKYRNRFGGLVSWSESDASQLSRLIERRDALFGQVSEQLAPHRSSAFGTY